MRFATRCRWTSRTLALNKNDLAAAVAKQTGLEQRQAKNIVQTTLDVIAEELAAGRDVSLSGFGKFSVTQRAARPGRNPSSGQTINIAASKAAKFSAAGGLKTRLYQSRSYGLPGEPDEGPLSGNPDEESSSSTS
jgi:DNA-binding protein HU-beta